MDLFSKQRQRLEKGVALAAEARIESDRDSFADYTSREIHLYRTDADWRADKPALTVYYLGVPDTTPEFSSREAMDRYLTTAKLVSHHSGELKSSARASLPAQSAAARWATKRGQARAHNRICRRRLDVARVAPEKRGQARDYSHSRKPMRIQPSVLTTNPARTGLATMYSPTTRNASSARRAWSK